jgi:hypothetical protein
VFRRSEAADQTRRSADSAEEELNTCVQRASTAFRHRNE